MQSQSKHSTPRKASSAKAQPSSSPTVAKPLPSHTPLISFAVKGTAPRSISGPGPPRPPAAVFEPQPRSSVAEMASLPAKPPPSSQAIPFPRSAGPRDVLHTHTMSVLGASSLSMPLAGPKAVKMELEEGEEGEVAEESAEAPVPGWGDSQEVPAAMPTSPLPGSALSSQSIDPESSRKREPRRRSRWEDSPPSSRKSNTNAASSGLAEVKKESAPRSQENKDITSVKWNPDVDKAEASRTSSDRNRDEPRHRSQSRGTAGTSGSVRSLSRSSAARNSPPPPSSSQQWEQPRDHSRRADLRANYNGARSQEAIGQPPRNHSGYPGSQESTGHPPRDHSGYSGRPSVHITGHDRSAPRDRLHDPHASRPYRDDDRNHERHGLPYPPSQSARSKGLDYNQTGGDASQGHSRGRYEDRNDSQRRGTGHSQYQGSYSGGNRSNDNGQQFSGDGHGERDARYHGDSYDQQSGVSRENGYRRRLPIYAEVQQKPNLPEEGWGTAIEASNASFIYRPGWNNDAPNQNASQNNPKLERDYRSPKRGRPPYNNGPVAGRSEAESRQAPPHIDQHSHRHSDREPRHDTGRTPGYGTGPRDHVSHSAHRGRSRDRADYRQASQQREYRSVPVQDEMVSLKRPASPLPAPEDRSEDERVHKRQRIDSEPVKEERPDMHQQEVAVEVLPSLPPDQPPGPPEDDIPPAPPSPPPAPPFEPPESNQMDVDSIAPPAVSIADVADPSVVPDESTDVRDTPSRPALVESEHKGGASAMSIIPTTPAVKAESRSGANTANVQDPDSIAVPGAPLPMDVVNPVTPDYSPVVPAAAATLPSSPVFPASQAATVWRQTSPRPQSSPTMPAGAVQSFEDPSRAPTPNPNATFSLLDLCTPASNVEGRSSVPGKEAFIRRRGDKLDPAADVKAYDKNFTGVAKLDDFIMPTGADKKDATLGKGTFGVVTKATRKKGNQLVALKLLQPPEEAKGQGKAGVLGTTIREIKILKLLDHENIVPLLDIVVDREQSNDLKTFLVFPYMDHDLCGLLKNPSLDMTDSLIKLYMLQLLEGVAYMHHNNIVHRDLKSANILLNNSGLLQIADFGLARAVPEEGLYGCDDDLFMTNMVVTRWYRAPELFMGETQYGFEVDMWSVGCILSEMFTRRVLFMGRSDPDQLKLIFDLCGTPEQTYIRYETVLKQKEVINDNQSVDSRKVIPVTEISTPSRQRVLREDSRYHHAIKEFKDLLDKFLQVDPTKRITAAKALEDRYIWMAPGPLRREEVTHLSASKERRDQQEEAEAKERTREIERVQHAHANIQAQMATSVGMANMPSRTHMQPPPSQLPPPSFPAIRPNNPYAAAPAFYPAQAPMMNQSMPPTGMAFNNNTRPPTAINNPYAPVNAAPYLPAPVNRPMHGGMRQEMSGMPPRQTQMPMNNFGGVRQNGMPGNGGPPSGQQGAPGTGAKFRPAFKGNFNQGSQPSAAPQDRPARNQRPVNPDRFG